jgi:hypothetical protein
MRKELVCMRKWNVLEGEREWRGREGEMETELS